MNKYHGLKVAANTLLDIKSEIWQLHGAIKEMRNIFSAISPILGAENRSFISGETTLSTGLAIAPDYAATVLSDIKRTAKFLRGVKEAIDDGLDTFKHRPVHLLYAGCGPYATLVLPLLHFYTPKQLKVTLIDIHQISLDSVETILDQFGITDYVDSLLCCDACKYIHPEDDPVHIIVTETMAQLLQKEPQVSITHNLAPQLIEGGILIPAKVIISLKAVNSGKNHQRLMGTLSDKEHDQVAMHIEDIFVLDKNCMHAQKCSRKHATFWIRDIVLPRIPQQFNQLQLYTEIEVYNDHLLKAYESSLTGPLDFTIGEEVNELDSISFSYQISPGIVLI